MEQGKKLYQDQQYAEAVQIWQMLINDLANDKLNQAMAFSNLSLTYQQLGQWQEAEQAIRTSQQLLATVSNRGTDRDLVLAQTLEILGHLQLMKGQPEQALANWQQAEQLYRHLKQPSAVAQSQINQAQALQHLGNNVRAQKVLDEANQGLQQQPDPLVKVTGLRSLGNVLRKMGKLTEARAPLQSALAIAQQAVSPWLEAEILLDLGNLNRAQAEYFNGIAQRDDAIAALREAQQQYQTVLRHQGLPNLHLRAAFNDLDAFMEQQALLEQLDWTAAQARFVALPALMSNLPVNRGLVYARIRYVQQGLTLLKHRQDVDRRSLAQEGAIALQQAQQLQDQRAEVQALHTLSNLYIANQQPDYAKGLTEQALKLAYTLNAPDLIYQAEWQMGQLLAQNKENSAILERAIDHYTTAINALDRVRHNLLPANPDVQFSFRDQVEPVYRQLVDLLLQQPSPEHLKRSVEYIDALQLAELENFLRCRLLRRERIDVKTAGQAAFLHSILLPDRVVAIFEQPGQSPKLHPTAIPQETAEAILQELQLKIRQDGKPEAIQNIGNQVYQWLIAPFEADLGPHSDIETLVLTLDGALKNIPVTALYDAKRDEYVVEKSYAIAFTPGLSLFELKPFPKDQITILAAGVSEGRFIENHDFPMIKGVKQELDTIAGVFPAQVTKLLDSAFSETALRQQLRSSMFTIVHLATHGAFSTDPDKTYIMTFDHLIRGYAWNELLSATSQTTLKPIDLLVMSACETAKGDRRAVLGLAGIAVRSGAHSTVSSLWQVSDTSTAKLMANFYTELQKPNATRAQALHQAQRSILDDPSLQYKSPYYWAAFVLVGNWL